MKILLLFPIFAVAATTAAAQAPQPDVRKRIEGNALKLENLGIHTPVPQPGTSVSITPGLYQLQQDKMPCIVPDTKAIVAIPNALPELKISATPIPNPATPQRMEKVESLKAPGSK